MREKKSMTRSILVAICAGMLMITLPAAAQDAGTPMPGTLSASYPGGQAVAVRQEPVWQRIGLMDATPTIEAVTEWLQQL